MIENDIKMKNIENSTIPLVSIIILNYNAGNLLIDCVDSIQKTNHENYEIIVVDNDSQDDKFNSFQEQFNEIKHKNNNYENIDSHDNSLYHKTLTNKDSKIHPNINNYDYSAKALVDDFNRRWKKNLTVEQYYKMLK